MSGTQPSSAARLVHDGRRRPVPPRPSHLVGDPHTTAILGLPEQPSNSLYATSEYGRVQWRSTEVGVVRRRLWALRLLVAAWTLGSAVTLWMVVTWCGWPTAVFTHTPMAVLLIALSHTVWVERRWLARVRADASF